MPTLEGHVDLNRRFAPVHNSGRVEDAATSSYTKMSGPDGTIGWNGLLKENLVVVLGEPGSGKSREFRSQAELLKRAGQPAFHIELERLVSGAWTDSASPEDKLSLDRWIARASRGYFFLDSVDEAKIRRAADFYTALDKVVALLGRLAISRAHVFISSRISEWQPETDLREVGSRFGLARTQAGSDSTHSPTLVVQIEPLDRFRVRTFVEKRGVDDADRFLEAIDNHTAWEFARRPIDVLDLAEFWKANGRLGTLTEIIEHDVRAKLKETTLRSNSFPLSEEKARDGAEYLAASSILCKRPQFKVPDDNLLAPDALDAAACLPADWVSAEVAALLSRPLFDSATYGRIRIHHRRVAEYLAACWFRSRMSKGCSPSTLVDKMFERVGDAPVPRRSVLPVIAWLCDGNAAWNDDLRCAVLKGCPEIHFEYGDPERLPLEYKRKALRAWLDLNKDRLETWTTYSPEALRRLAEPRLAKDVAEWLRPGSTSGSIRELLVALVRHGKLVECIPTLLTILGDATEADDVRVAAMAALRDMGTPDSHAQARDILKKAATLPRYMCAIACETLYPDTMSASEMALLLEKPCSEQENTSNLQFVLERHLGQCVTPDRANELIREVNRLITSPPHFKLSDKDTRISERFAFLLEVLPNALQKALSNTAMNEEQCKHIAESLSLIAEAHPFHQYHHGEWPSFDEATCQHPEVRRRFLGHTLARLRRNKSEAITPWLLTYNLKPVIDLEASDIEWLCRAIQETDNLSEKELLLRLALRLAPARSLGILERTVGSDAGLLAIVKEHRSAHLWKWYHRLRRRIGSSIEWKYWWLSKKHDLRRLRTAVNDRWWLLRNRKRLSSGVISDSLADLCREASRDNHRYSEIEWKQLAKKRGDGVAKAVERGSKLAWRRYSPQLPHEKARPNTVNSGVIIGLAGIQSAINDGDLQFDLLSDDEVRLMSRYAVNELNGFPDWFDRLATAKVTPVTDVLGACIDGEWCYASDRKHAHDVLADIASKGGRLAQLVRPRVMANLVKGDPAHPAVRDAAVKLLLKTADLPDAALAEVAASRCRGASVDSTEFVLWSAVGLQLNGDEAIDILEERLRASLKSDEIVLEICHLLGGEWRRELPVLPNASFVRAPTLARWIPLVYSHVRPSEDVDRANGEAYSPTVRDEAARFRDGLFTRLANSDDPAAVALLRGLSDRPELKALRDWILHLIDERMTRDADTPTWTPAAVRAFGSDPTASDPRPDVLLVTVNEHETTAVLEGFRKATGVTAVPVPIEDRIYNDLDTLNGARVFHVISAMGSGGVGAMQQTVDRAIRALRPGAIIAVGIAFGIDEQKQSIGDVLLSTQLRPYELQRVGKHGIKLRGPHPDASPRLVSHFRTFAQTAWKGGRVRPGTLLTGEKLVDNVDYRNELLSYESEAIGGEMEGAGLYAAGHDHKVDWIVLKAICDFADGNKGHDKEGRQKGASENAVAFLIAAMEFAPLRQAK